MIKFILQYVHSTYSPINDDAETHLDACSINKMTNGEGLQNIVK